MFSFNIISSNLDELVIEGIKHIEANGDYFNARAGSGIQAFDVNYILTNSQDRIHLLRDPTSTRYLSRELLAYFRGSLNVDEGLSQASSFWKHLADKEGNICSNYGYYVFHEPIESCQNQYAWVISSLIRNPDSRKASICINQSYHKKNSKDFPCTL